MTTVLSVALADASMMKSMWVSGVVSLAYLSVDVVARRRTALRQLLSSYLFTGRGKVAVARLGGGKVGRRPMWRLLLVEGPALMPCTRTEGVLAKATQRLLFPGLCRPIVALRSFTWSW